MTSPLVIHATIETTPRKLLGICEVLNGLGARYTIGGGETVQSQPAQSTSVQDGGEEKAKRRLPLRRNSGELGRRLKEVRLSLRISQDEIAIRLGFSHQGASRAGGRISQIERGLAILTDEEKRLIEGFLEKHEDVRWDEGGAS